MKIAFHTLGCKLNQFDTAVMKEQAREARHRVIPFNEKADVYVINTCSVTEKSHSESRYWIRKAHRANPEAKIIVTGCYAQTHPEELIQIKGVDLVLGTQERGEWLNYLGGCDKALGPLAFVDTTFSKTPLDQPLIHRFADRTRAIVKVQDGCEFNCSFCIIPRARGPSRSVPIERVIEQVRWLVENGYQEVVLTGVSLGSYGRDFLPKLSLAGLMLSLLEETRIRRIRLSSIEPKTVTSELIEVLASSSRICRHFHIPVQSGDNRILKSMNRHYTREFYRGLIETLDSKIPGVCIGTDVLAGFPSEGETEFENTYELLLTLPMSYFHVFPYSPRPQTPAAVMEGQIPDPIKLRRNQKLRALSTEKLQAFQKAFLGKTLQVLVEEERDPDVGFLKGYTDNYIKVLVEGPDPLKSRLLPVTLRSITEKGVVGERSPVTSVKLVLDMAGQVVYK